MNKNNFGNRMKSARKMAGMSLQDLADKIGGISKQALSKYETGKTKYNSDILIKVANATGVNPEYLLREPKYKIEFENIKFNYNRF